MNNKEIQDIKGIISVLEQQKKKFFEQLKAVEKFALSQDIEALKEACETIKTYHEHIAQLTAWLANALEP